MSKLFLKAIWYCHKISVPQVRRGSSVSWGMYIKRKLFLFNPNTERESKSHFYECPEFYDYTGQLSVEMKVNTIQIQYKATSETK